MTTHKVHDLLKARNEEFGKSTFGIYNPQYESDESISLNNLNNSLSTKDTNAEKQDQQHFSNKKRFSWMDTIIVLNNSNLIPRKEGIVFDEGCNDIEKNNNAKNPYSCCQLNAINLEKDVEKGLDIACIVRKAGDSDSEDDKDSFGSGPVATVRERCIHFFKKYFIVFGSLLVCGIGIGCAGLLLDHVQAWKVYSRFNELLTLIPPLLSLKGNTEMTLASRLSTQANLDMLRSCKSKIQSAWGNICLVICQGVIVSTIAAVIICAIGTISKGNGIDEWLFIMAACQITTVLSTFAQTLITLGVIFACKKVNLNPDDVATPIAASLGDCITLAFLSYISHWLFTIEDDLVRRIICGSIIGVVVFMLPILLYLSYKNKFTNGAFKEGWVPIIIAIIITGAGGQVLGHSITAFAGIGLFQPFFNGFGGNVVSIMSSRTSTFLNKNSKPGQFPKNTSSAICAAPWEVLFSNSYYSRTARRLLSMTIPAHLIFGFALHAVSGYNTPLGSAWFVALYLATAFIQVSFLLFVAFVLIQILWKKGFDPDNSAIPFLTALSDLLGTVMLAGIFWAYYGNV